MKYKIRLFNLLIIFVLLSACNLPRDDGNQGGDANSTAAAQTVEALLSATPSTGGFATATNTPALAASII